SPAVEDEIIDPLIHADLYEEVTKCDRYGTDAGSSILLNSPDDSVGILKHLPSDVCDISVNCFAYTAAVLGKRFLLAGMKGLKTDRDVRISHKILALNCITTISKHEDLSKVMLLFGDFEQSLGEVSRFILHDDDQLCASTVAFLFSLDKHESGATDNAHNYRRVMRAFQPIRKRSVLQAAIGQQHVLEALGILPEALYLATTEVSSTFFLLKVTCAEFLSSLRWNLMKNDTKEEWQERCLSAYFDLLFSDDQKVAQAALAGLERVVKNADFTEYSGVFATRIPDDLISLDKDSLPAVLNMPREFRFRGECADFVVESNLEMILYSLIDYFSMDVHGRSGALCSTMDALLKAFPAAVFPECWGCLSKQPSSSCGFLSTVVELCEINLDTPKKLADGLKVMAALFAGYCESYMMNVVQEQVTVDRMTLPRLPDQLLLDRLLLMPLRVLNMYYSLIAEYRAVMTQSSASLLSRPTLSPLPTKKVSPSRIADISRLLGTSIHPALQTSYLECPTVKSVFHSVEGAHRNFLEGVDRDVESRFVFLLRAALDCLGTICEMLTFSQMRPLLQEILLYVKILGVMCELPRDGIIYAMADPKKVLFEAVTTQLYDPGTGNKELLTEIALYLIVLARTNVIKYDQVSRVAVELIEKVAQTNAEEIISAVEVILLEILFAQRMDASIIYAAFRNKSKMLFSLASQRTLLLWTLFLHASRNDESRWSSTSVDFFAAYSEYSTDCSESALNHSVYAVVTSFSCMAPAMYRPVDSILQLLQSSMMDENISLPLKLKRSVPLLFSVLNNVAEEKLLMRAEQMLSDPLDWLVRILYDLLMASIKVSFKADNLLLDYVLFLLQTLVNVFKAEKYPKLSASLQGHLKESDPALIRTLSVTQPAVLSLWMQLCSLYDEPLDKYVDVAQCTE
ncbi:hypothetical protein GCK32_009085, partial [Trichostrongylus colubriformis]